MARRAFVIGVLLLAAVFLWPLGDDLVRQLPSFFLRRSPHDEYVRQMRNQGVDQTESGRAWLAAAELALTNPDEVAMAHSRRLRFDATHPAHAWRFPVRRGQQLTIDVAFPASAEGYGGARRSATREGGRHTVFIDLFRAEDGEPPSPGLRRPRRLASAAREASRLTYTVKADDEVIARVQAPLERHGPVRVLQRADATLRFPVEGVTPRAVGGGFGEGRDRGRRRHEGIDIFAPRGTPAIAAIDGWVTAQTTNRLGGNVVWIWSMRHRIGLYYAHLDRNAVSPGERVQAGDVIGYVGNTGNARGTSPHLHFGVYAPPSGAVDPLPFVCDAPCGERLMQPRLPPRAGTQVESD